MQIKDMKKASFPLWQEVDWIQKSEQSLKGKKVENLTKYTYEQIKLKPLYFKKDQTCSQFPGEPDYRRGINSYTEKKDWHIAQTIKAKSINVLIERLEAATKSGQTAISFSVQDQTSYESIFQLFASRYPFCVDAEDHLTKLLHELTSIEYGNGINGYIASDPLSQLASDGFLEKSMNDIYDEFSTNILIASKQFPSLKTILVNTTPYHNGGANAVQEIAISLATAVFHLEELVNRNIPLDTILSKLVFCFSIGTNFFMEIAKLRAARMLWSEVVKAYGGTIEHQKMVISAQTSTFTKTIYDPYVNLLRSGSEAFAAVIGGAQYLHVAPYNELEGEGTDFSERIARNMQLILKEEALLSKTHDPVGGSWYIEELTDEIAKKAWELFVQIDEYGGILTSLVDGKIQAQISDVLEKRMSDSFTRKQTIIGTNMYANLQDKPLKPCPQKKVVPQSAVIIIPELKQCRLSEPYEILRLRSEQWEQRPKVGLICLGDIKHVKPQADFMTGFLSPGGITTDVSPSVKNWDDFSLFIEKSNLSVYCLCGAYGDYEEFGLSIAKSFQMNFPEKQLYMAGLPMEKEKWIESGVTDFFHRKSNCYESLSSLLTEMEETTHA